MVPDCRGTLRGVFQAAGPLPGLPQSLVLAVFFFPATLCLPYLGSTSSSMLIPIFIFLQTSETGYFISKSFCCGKNIFTAAVLSALHVCLSRKYLCYLRDQLVRNNLT